MRREDSFESRLHIRKRVVFDGGDALLSCVAKKAFFGEDDVGFVSDTEIRAAIADKNGALAGAAGRGLGAFAGSGAGRAVLDPVRVPEAEAPLPFFV